MGVAMLSTRFLLFIASLLAGFLYAFFAVFFVTEAVVPPEDVSQIDYRLLLLKKVEGQRVFIDSGSNSLWAIFPEIFSDIIGAPTFVISENGSVPIDFKIRKWKKYVRSGDIVVLPLEYGFYQKNDVTSSFVEEVFGVALKGGVDKKADIYLNIMHNYAYHYHIMDFVEKLRFIHNFVNPDYLILARDQRLIEPPISTQFGYRLDHLRDVYAKQTGGDVKNDANRVKHKLTNEMSCFDFIQSYPTRDESAIEHIANALAQMQAEKGATFVITWPAVAGSNCYEKEKIGKLTEQVRRIFEGRGIQVIGEPEDSSFDEKHLLDTYFHVDSDAARIRTQKLATSLRLLMTGEKAARKPNSLQALAGTVVNDELFRGDLALARAFEPISSGEFTPGDAGFQKHFRLFFDGWSGIETWGVWSIGPHSRIAFNVGTRACALTIKGNQFSHSSSSFQVITQKGSVIPFSNSVIVPGENGWAIIDVAHSGIASPRQLGTGEDDRMLGYGLERISINCEPKK